MDNELTSSALRRLLGINKSVLSELVSRGIVKHGDKRNTYAIESVASYCQHLREIAAGRGGEDVAAARARLGSAQARLAETKAKQRSGELVETTEVETFWRTKLKAFRNRVLAIPHRVEYLSARQTLTLTQELRACLDELADDKAALNENPLERRL
jgi:phage terminase Nu1 subunit (DNA packaging protein)